MKPAFAVVAAVVVATCMLGTAPPAAADGSLPSVRRVLVISLPGVTWEDVKNNDVPAIRSIVDASAVANMAVRVQQLKTAVNDGYATVGSGTRALARVDDAGLAFEPGEPIEADDAAAAYRRMTGHRLTGIAAHLRIAAVKVANVKSLYHAKVATLGDALAKQGIGRAVVANADIRPVASDLSSYHREALLAMMDSRGQVPCGAIGDELLQKDAAAAFGIALDPVAVEAAVSRCWRGRSVVLVEGSDLLRAERYAPRVLGARYTALRRAALVRTDRLVARLLAHVDPTRDAVVLIAPSSPQTTKPQLTVFAVRAPGLQPGLLESGVTRQGGFVSIVDVGPTIASLVRAPLASDLEGDAAAVSRQGGTAGDRISFMVDANTDAQFRDRIMSTFVSTFITIVLLIALAAVISMRFGRAWRWLEPLSLGMLATLALTYWAALLPFAEWGSTAYFVFTFGGGLALGLMADFARRWFTWPVVFVLTFMLATTVISVVLLHSRLQLSTVFGDSPIVAGRFQGINNVTFSQLMVAAILLGGFIRMTSERFGRWLVLVLFVAVALVDGAPMWGADVGGVLAGVPALALTFTLLGGWRVRIRTVATFAVVTGALIGGLGLLDLTRDPSHRTHLGRLFANVGHSGSNPFTTVVHRKLDANLVTLTNSVWRFMFVPVVIMAAYVVWRAPDRLGALRRRLPMLDPCFIGVGAAAVLGYALNDSGIAVPAMMLAVLALATVYLLNRVEQPVEEPIEIPNREPLVERLRAPLGG